MERDSIAVVLMAGLLVGWGPRVFDMGEEALEERARAAVLAAEVLLRVLGLPSTPAEARAAATTRDI